MQTPTNHQATDHSDRNPMCVAVSGSSGLIGSALVARLAADGHRVRRLVRGRPNVDSGELPLPVESRDVDASAYEGLDAVVHLAGENVIARRWNPEQKERLRTSRVEPTRRLCELLVHLDRPPKVLVCASAVGFYGHRGDELVDEDSPPCDGFMADVCRQWEATTDVARQQGIRVVLTRFGMVLSPRGGALPTLLPPFRLGLGGPLGSGRQYWSWIAIDDVVGAVCHALTDDRLVGPVNMVSPEPATSRQFAKTLARVLHRPALCRVPSMVLRMLLGQIADEMILAGARVVPSRLQAADYTFLYPKLEEALRHLVKS